MNTIYFIYIYIYIYQILNLILVFFFNQFLNKNETIKYNFIINKIIKVDNTPTYNY